MFVQMKTKAILLFILLAFSLNACNKIPQDAEITPFLKTYEIALTEDDYKNDDYTYKFNTAIHGNDTNDVNYFENSIILGYDYGADCKQIISVTTKQIHETLPVFTFIRIVGDYVENHLIYDIPFAVEVTIIIEDDEGRLIQKITGLTQSNIFLDFDEYSIKNEQLTKIMGLTEINTNQETRQIETWLRTNANGGEFYYFAYYNGEYILINQYLLEGFARDFEK